MQKTEISEMNKQEIAKLANRIRNARTKKDLVKIIEPLTLYGEKRYSNYVKELKFDITWNTRELVLWIAKTYIIRMLPGNHDFRRRG